MSDRRVGTIEVQVPVILVVKWETDQKGQDPKPIVGSGFPCLSIRGSRWTVASAIMDDPEVLGIVQAAIQGAHQISCPTST